MWRWAGIDSRPWGPSMARVPIQHSIPPFPTKTTTTACFSQHLRRYRFFPHLDTSIRICKPTSIRTSIDCIASSHLMRRTSVSLPTRNVAYDPHEKPARYNKGANTSAAAILEKIKIAWMTQSQRSRYLKTGGVLLLVVFLFYYLSPRGTDIYTGGRTRINPSLKPSNTSVQ
jgi:hypothetical protein